MVRNIILYNAVKKLRIEGRSYSEISAELHVSKGTVSGWLSKVKWSVKTKSLLIAQNNKYSAKRIILMNKQKSKQKLERHVQYCQEAKKEYKHLRKSSLFLVGLAIYWGEGEKALKNGRVSVINSDVNILQIVVDFYEKILNIPDKKIRAAMFIYKDIDPDKALL
ncbi:hypothetical protein HY950_02450, partial [Candidatus Gottesmanbacteria bacterium]|nr:hypothetical protein [Candidatus Gottesmanbacteria bacterium]